MKLNSTCLNLILLPGLVRMTEDRGINSGFAGVDLIVAVAENVPETILVDEAYVCFFVFCFHSFQLLSDFFY